MINILVCDDDKDIVDAIEIYLAPEGYHIKGIRWHSGHRDDAKQRYTASDHGRYDAAYGRYPGHVKNP